MGFYLFTVHFPVCAEFPAEYFVGVEVDLGSEARQNTDWGQFWYVNENVLLYLCIKLIEL